MEITGSSAAEIFDNVRLLVQAGALAAGDSLPPVRELADTLGVNRNTVASAYRRLVTSGIAQALGRNGTVIRAQGVAGEQEGAAEGSRLRDLASGNPDPGCLPDPRACLPGRPVAPRLYGHAVVNPSLESACRPWLAPDCPGPFDVNLTHGAVDAVERLLAAHLVPGDTVVLEAPCFLSSLNTMRAAGYHVAEAPVDSEGMRPEALDAALANGAQAVILTPRAHNPTGYSLTPRRAKKLASVLARHPHVLIISDDHYASLAETPYANAIPAKATRWALVRSVSKVLGPDLRLAFVASDADTSRRLRLRLAPGTNWVSHLLQDMAEAALFGKGAAQRIARAKRLYAQRRALLLDALAEHGLAAGAPSDGLNVWIPLDVESRRITDELAQRGWLVRSGDIFGGGTNGIRVTMSTLLPSEASAFARDLAGILAS
jgi:DNA-binding transcriptional MocR family regulator